MTLASLRPGPRPHPLELRIPPPIVGVVFGAAMWGVSRIGSITEVPALTRTALLAPLALLGVALGVSANIALRRARTTVNPFKPHAASSLVTGGVFRFTRNPMYLGMTCLLLGWAAYLVSPLALLGPTAFVLYIDRFQIAPEERALSVLFGEAFAAYTSEVRRWV